VAFGALEATSPEKARAQAEAWLKEVGKTDATTTTRFTAIWAQDERPVLDRLADTFALGDERAAKLLADARDPLTSAPTSVPTVLTDDKASTFFRANLALAYARALSNRRVHEEALASLKGFQAEQVVAPSTFLFTRAVCEHALLKKPEATKTIIRLLEDSVGSPERYKTVSALMLLDMQTWKEKDLAAVARKMENIERRLDLARGGPETQKLQREVIARLDELIKELENKAKQQQQQQGGGECPNGGSCPSGGQQPGSSPGQTPGNNPTAPMQDSKLGGQGGTGRVDPAKMKKLLDGWGKMQPREQAKALQELTRGMSPKHREAIENYFRNLANRDIAIDRQK
jgi:polyhydroxyalkanoate synthesis regulator phasin